MESFEGKLAVVTGGGSGMGRALVVQLAAAGCRVAACDLRAEPLAGTLAEAGALSPPGTAVTAHVCDVADADQVARFRDEVVARHGTDHIDLLFNNAGAGGGTSFLTSPPSEWERTFAICWGGVYHCTRAFTPLLIAADDGCLVNTSSVNGFLASIPGHPITAYSTAKFAVKGFTEALIEDFRIHAPHVRVILVLPGHVGTDFPYTTRRALGLGEPRDMSDSELTRVRADLARRGVPEAELDDAAVTAMVTALYDGFRAAAPVTAEQAATIILDGVRAGEWRILIGDDARLLDEAVRADPGAAYRPGFLDRVR